MLNGNRDHDLKELLRLVAWEAAFAVRAFAAGQRDAALSALVSRRRYLAAAEALA